MSIFDDLRIAYRASQETYREYARNSLAAAQELAHSFREHIGAPETFADPDGETRRPYVHLLSFQIREGVPTAVQPESQNDILTREPDGFWRFAMSLTLDRDLESFPKQQLVFFLRLKVRGGVWQVQLLDDAFQELRISTPRESDRKPLFDHMIGMVRRLLAAKPWEGVEKLPIGFELQHLNPVDDSETPEAPLAQP